MRHIRHSLRVIRKNPGVSTLSITSLVLAITLNAVIFSLVDWLWLSPSPYVSPHEVVRVFASSDRNAMGSFSWPDYEDIRDGAQTVSGLAAAQHRGASLVGEEYSVELLADVVSRNFFDVLGARAHLGTMFSESDPLDIQAQPMVVISHNLWQRHYGGDPDIIGATVTITGRDRVVAGIADRSFYGLNRMVPIDVWFPVETWGNPEERVSREFRDFYLVGRLQPGIEASVAEAEFDTYMRQLELKDLSTQTDQIALVQTEVKYQNSQSSSIGILLFVIVGAVLLIACANVSGLMLARSITRQREMAVRLATGASRSHLIRQLVAEGVVLSLIAVGISLLLANWVLHILPSLMPSVPFYIEFGFALDDRTILFALFLGLFTTVLTGLLPALNASRPDLVPLLKGGVTSNDRRGRRAGSLNLLVIGQFALSFVLIASTGLLLRSFNQVYAVDPGFNRKDILVATIYPPGGRSEAGSFCIDLLDRVRNLPGVMNATISRHVPFFPSGGGATRRVYDPDSGEGWSESGVAVKFNIVEQEYFETLDIPIIQGRFFTDADDANSALVIMVNQTMAETYWPGEDPVGKTLILNSPGDESVQIIGLVPDGKYNYIEEEPEPYFYMPIGQLPWWDYLLLVYTGGDVAPVVEPIRREILAMDSQMSVFPMTTLYQIMRDKTYDRELIMWLALFFTGLGVLLSATGLFGVITYTVTRRTHEFGVRMALGAQKNDVLLLVLRLGGRLGLLGLMIGLPLALAISQLMRSMLFGVAPIDPISLVIALVVVVGVSLLATIVPGFKATNVDPLVVIRYE